MSYITERRQEERDRRRTEIVDAADAVYAEAGWDAVTMPGAVDTWVRLSERFGRLPFTELFPPALDYAEKGFPLSPRIAAQWEEAESLNRDFSEFGRTFLLDGRAPTG